MLIKQVMEIFELLDSASASGDVIRAYMESKGAKNVTVRRVEQDGRGTDFISIIIPGKNGKMKK